MSLTLYFHPLASFCWKVLIALYENDTLFTPHLIDLAGSRRRFHDGGLRRRACAVLRQ